MVVEEVEVAVVSAAPESVEPEGLSLLALMDNLLYHFALMVAGRGGSFQPL